MTIDTPDGREPTGRKSALPDVSGTCIIDLLAEYSGDQVDQLGSHRDALAMIVRRIVDESAVPPDAISGWMSYLAPRTTTREPTPHAADSEMQSDRPEQA